MKLCTTYQNNHHQQMVVSVLLDGGSLWNSEGAVLNCDIADLTF